MTRDGARPQGLDKLEAALDTYGADRTRWPAPLRHTLSAVIASNGDAQKMLEDAEAFDRLLDSAPGYDAHRISKLKDRIVTAAERQPRLVSTQSTKAPPPRLRRHHGLAATALAASLVLGVFAGQSNFLNTAADSLLGGDSNSAKVSRQMAQSDDADGLLDEDIL